MANERTEAAVMEDLARVRTALAALEGDVDGKLTDYTKGGRTFHKGARYGLLMRREERLLDELRGLPCCEETVLDHPDV